jgi:hypothetical protein
MVVDKSFLEIRKLVRTQGKHVMQKLFDDYLTGPISKKRIPSCFLCGSEKNITKEHILPKWVFESNSKHYFISDVNQLNQSYIKATVPACVHCNSVLLNNIERYIQKTLSEVDLIARYYSPDEWENIIRWLEIIDYKFQIWDLRSNFIKHKKHHYIPDLADFSIAFMRDMSVRSVTSKTRLALKRVGTKNKTHRANSLIVGRTIKKTFHYFHNSGQFMHLELPTYNKGFFYFFEKKHKTDKAALKESTKIIKFAYNLP